MRSTVAVYAFGHFAVDFGSVFYLSTVAGRSGLEPAGVYACYLVYALLAFGTQPFLGLVGDRFQQPRALAGTGLALVLAGLPLAGLPWLGVGLVGLGNALFHLGGGTVTANLAPARAKYLGFFVAPGALGLLLAPLVARSQETPLLPAAALACALALLALHKTEGEYSREDNPLRAGVLLGLLLVVVLRSAVGAAVVFPWKAELPLLALLTLGVVLGKALGGEVGDRLGWRRTAVGSLLASLALIPFGAAWPALGILAMLLFNFTMPIVLAALVREMPRNPGFAFGLNCLALLAGAVPLFHPVAVPLPVVALGILLSAVLLLVALEDPR